jgi:DNA-binding NarL/FixJ family response regulator
MPLSIASLEKLIGISSEHAVERLSELTPRETEIIDLLTSGTKPRKIAEGLGISPKTLDIHRANIKRKLGVRTDIDVAKFVIVKRICKAIGKRNGR